MNLPHKESLSIWKSKACLEAEEDWNEMWIRNDVKREFILNPYFAFESAIR